MIALTLFCLFTYFDFSFSLLLLVKYLVHLYNVFKEWRKNPYCSFSCCLDFLLTLNDLQGEVCGLSGKNILNSQLQTGNMEKPCIAASAKESGVMSITITCGKENLGDDKTTVLQKRNCKGVKYSNRKCHQGTQTDVFTLPMAHMVVRESLEGTQEIYVSTKNTFNNLFESLNSLFHAIKELTLSTYN